MVFTSTEAPSCEDENTQEAVSTESPIPKPPNLAGRPNNCTAKKLGHPIMQDKIHHLNSQEEDEKAVHNQESLSGDETIQTIEIWPTQHEQPKVEKQPHQSTDEHTGTIPVPQWKQIQLLPPINALKNHPPEHS